MVAYVIYIVLILTLPEPIFNRQFLVGDNLVSPCMLVVQFVSISVTLYFGKKFLYYMLNGMTF